ncbi:MAG: YhcU family protein [Bacillales bacterium]|nr:YhcU family protein [Bacillales bacterium]
MKIIIASTFVQKETIQELIEEIYRDIFPMYFSDEEIRHFWNLQVLHITDRHFQYFDTLKEAFQVIASLQTVVSILSVKAKRPLSQHYETIFNQNVQILQKFDLFFPFAFEQFTNHYFSVEKLSMFTKANNELLL